MGHEYAVGVVLCNRRQWCVCVPVGGLPTGQMLVPSQVASRLSEPSESPETPLSAPVRLRLVGGALPRVSSGFPDGRVAG